MIDAEFKAARSDPVNDILKFYAIHVRHLSRNKLKHCGKYYGRHKHIIVDGKHL